MKHPNLLEEHGLLPPPTPRFERRAHIGGKVGVGFAGGGGSSLGLKWAGLSIDFAMNHDAAAIAMHSANCPEAHHYCQDIWQVRPEDPCPGEPIRFMWFSPDCKHFSKAKGGQPVEKKIRDLAWVIVLWARIRRPDVICMENVEEFKTWGPLMADPKRPGRMIPDPARKGEYFAAFVAEFQRLGYDCGFIEERAWRFGAPTIRKRMFGQFRCDGQPITWPEPTHGAPDDPAVIAGRLLPWRTIAECIDFDRPCPSIFLTRQEARRVRANRPLADATMARITLGLQRYVLEADRPYLIRVDNTSEGRPRLVVPHVSTMRNAQKPFNGVDEPGVTDTAGGANRALIAAHLAKFQGDSDGAPLDRPGPTITANSFEKRPGCAAPVGVAAAYLANTAHGEATPNGSRRWGKGHHDVGQPAPAFTGSRDHAVVAATMVQTGYGERPGQEPRALDVQAPVGTQVSAGAKHAPVAVYMAQHNGGVVGHRADKPMSTLLTAGCHQHVVASNLLHLRGSGERFGNRIDEPARTDTAGGNHQGISSAFLVKYYGAAQHGQRPDEPAHTDTPKPRFALVMVDLAVVGLTEEQRYTAWWVARMIDVWGHPDGLPPRGRRKRRGVGSLRLSGLQERIDNALTPRPSAVGTRGGYIVWDIGMRMLTVRERFRAQGVPDDFIIDVEVDGKPITETKQGEMCGNMVCPDHAEAIAGAALPELQTLQEAAE